MLKYVLLGALSYRPLTGYQLKQFIENSARHFWHAQTSQIYRTLETLEAQGLLNSATEPRDDNRDRRHYHLTEAGRADLLAWLRQPMTEVMTTKDELLVRLFFSAQVEKETVLTQLRLQRSLLEQQLDVFRTIIPEQIRVSLEQNPQLRRDALLWDAARRQGELGVKAYIDWLDETIQRIEEEW